MNPMSVVFKELAGAPCIYFSYVCLYRFIGEGEAHPTLDNILFSLCKTLLLIKINQGFDTQKQHLKCTCSPKCMVPSAAQNDTH